MIYLDHQASTSLHPAAAKAMLAAAADTFANPHSSDHAGGWAAADAIEVARSQVADTIGSDADEIVFTSGATEANNIALLGLDRPRGRRNRIVVSAIEHKAVLGPARELQRRGFELSIAPVSADGLVDLDAIASLIDERTALVSCMLVNNEVGTVQPVEQVAELTAKSGALFHIDAAQALSFMALDVVSLGAAMVSISAHKMGGPKGVGALFVRHDVRSQLRPIWFGGEQEAGMRPGTLPTPLCVGFGVACRNRPTALEVERWRSNTNGLECRLRRDIPGLTVNGDGVPRHPGAISIVFPDIDADAIVMNVQPGLAISRGSACTSGIAEPSHVLRAIGLSPAACERTARIGVGRTTPQEDLDDAADLLIRTYRDLTDVHGAERHRVR